MSLPNFFIVGAPKAGTDELYYDLAQHPEIYMSPLKEPCYFSSEIRVQNFEPALRPSMAQAIADTARYLESGMPGERFGGIVSSLDDYQRLFSRVKNEKAIGEGSVCYLWSATAAQAIASMLPHARIIIILMDPAERAFRQYLKSVSDGTVRNSFREHVEQALKSGQQLGVYHPFLDFGKYFDQVSRYLRWFPAEQLHVSIYEDTRSDHAAWFQRLLTFLGVNPQFTPAAVQVPSKPSPPTILGSKVEGAARRVGRFLPRRLRVIGKHLTRPGQLPELQADDRALLVDYYRSDMLRVQDLLQRDLSTWLQIR